MIVRSLSTSLHAALVILLCASFSAPAPAAAPATEIRRDYVKLGNGVPGLLHTPAAARTPSRIGVLVMHPGGDYLEFSAGPELARRGHHVLTANASTPKSGIGNDVGIEQLLSEVKPGVDFLRALEGVDTVVLLGHSGGGALMTAYQSVAENGPEIARGPEKIHPLSERLESLPPADGIILLDANYGLGTMVLFSLDPAVNDESGGRSRTPRLDLFNPDHGFRPEGAHFTQEFKTDFQAAIAWRMTRLIETAKTRLAAVEAGQGAYSDDEPLVIPGAVYLGPNNKLFSQDPTLLSRTRKEWPLLRANGETVVGIVSTVRKPKNTRSTTDSLRFALVTTLRTFLTTYAIRVGPDFTYNEDSIEGVSWRSSLTTPIGNVETISVPLLTLGMTGNWEFLAAEIIHDHAASADKTAAFVEGASHMITPCADCESTPDAFGDTVKTTYDCIDAWLRQEDRFGG